MISSSYVGDGNGLSLYQDCSVTVSELEGNLDPNCCLFARSFYHKGRYLIYPR